MDRQEPLHILDYASPRIPRRPTDWLRLAPLLAILCAAAAWMKSRQYHDIGHLPDEQQSTLLLVGFSIPFLAITLFRFRRYKGEGATKLAVMVGLSLSVVIVNALALWNLHTAIGYRLL